MRYDLAALARRAKPARRTRAVTIRDIAPPATFATDLYRSVYLPVVDAWTEVLPGIEAEYARTLAQMTQDSPADVEARIAATERRLDRLFILIRPLAERFMLRVESWYRGKWRGAVLSATSVDVGTLIGPADVRMTLEAAIERNVALVRDVSAQARQRIADAVFRGLSERRPAADVAREMREAVGMARSRSQRIASDQLVKITSALADERRREAGLTVYKYLHSGKRHPRAEHKARDGNLYSMEGQDVGAEVDGQKVLPPLAPEDRAGRAPYCGCRERGVVIF